MAGAVESVRERDESAVALVYGSILTGAAVVAASQIGHDPGMEIVYTSVTMVVVWIAHTYAAFVGEGGRLDVDSAAHRGLAVALEQLPVLAAALPAVIGIAIAWALGAGSSTAAYVGLAVSITAMCALAARAARETGAGGGGELAAAAGALVLGALLIAAKVALK
ncbi:MAG: hypothetical protein KDB58_12420 [Solirubrobacterales bacterium]|nr:hypothetical protein [Solirubrobacterales bacterium]